MSISKILQPFQFKSTSTQTILKDKNGIQTRVRTGKTAKDKANGHVAYKKNRRVWDDKDRKWFKQ